MEEYDRIIVNLDKDSLKRTYGPFDIFCFGNISNDIIETPSTKVDMIGGAIFHAVWTAHQLGYNVGMLTKTTQGDFEKLYAFPEKNVTIFWKESAHTTSIRNYYPTEDKEKRVCTSTAQADPYSIDDFPNVSANLWMYCALLTGEVSASLLKEISLKGKLIVDAQGVLRTVMPDGSMEFQPWKKMKEVLPHVSYFKADAAEAEYLTGFDTSQREGRMEAARFFISLGAKEVIISHNSELLAMSEDEYAIVPFKNRNLKGRTGRGDTSTTAYVLERQHHSMKDALLYSAALTSLKMEIPGPFHLKRENVEKFIQEYYNSEDL